MSNKVSYKGLARDVIFELSKSNDSDIIDKFIKELRRLSKHKEDNNSVSEMSRTSEDYDDFER